MTEPERPEQGPEQPHPQRIAGLRELVERGRARGFVTLEAVLDVVPAAEDDLQQLEDVLATLEESDIAVGERPVPPRRPAPRRRAESGGGIDSDDTISLYLREVGRVALLTGKEEVDLSQRIEAGTVARMRLAAQSNGTAPTPADTRRLRASAADGEAARHHLVKANARLVIAMAKRYMNQGVPFLDLIQEGNLGLMKAADKFDWRRGHKFSTYATWWVRQAITRALADQGRTIRVPVHMSDRIRRLYHTSRRLEQDLSRAPTLDEIARELGLTTRRVEQTLEVAQRPLSLEKPVGEDRDSELGEFIEDREQGDPDEEASRTMLREDLEHVLTSLSSREARVLQLRYGLADGHAYTLKEVGEKFGLTRERIRQIENDALEHLREPRRARRLADYMDSGAMP